MSWQRIAQPNCEHMASFQIIVAVLSPSFLLPPSSPSFSLSLFLRAFEALSQEYRTKIEDSVFDIKQICYLLTL